VSQAIDMPQFFFGTADVAGTVKLGDGVEMVNGDAWR